MKTFITMTWVLIVLSLTAPFYVQAELILNVLGQPAATGLIQQNKEKPFFENFSKLTGTEIKTIYTPLDQSHVKSEETLDVLKNGIFDIVSIRTAQAAGNEPFLLGQDLVGLNPNYETAKIVYNTYKPHFDKRIHEKYNSRLFGLWPFGPQVLFCKPEIKSLADIKGKKVRVYDNNLAKFIESLGASPVPIGFAQVKEALSLGICDCAITGASSANTAGWPQETQYFMPVGFQMGFNGYAVNLDTWNKLTPIQQQKIQTAFDLLINDIWLYSEELFNDALRCNVGREPCTTVTKYNMTEVPVTQADLIIIQKAFKNISVPSWSQECEKVFPGCSEKWKNIMSNIINLN
ncbi:TRAP transport system, periplasmic binding protein (DctP-like) [Desulfonema limicola]|uniref:TRAP transport system, periplasmic binding protein (DctP-like) n=1 Tax=Desulfonema limicola TaxID=45656 RepID=A0A975B9C8_9BACT|nr:TRAP transporter substrate-binding protein [Desulfonema limicola]QTA81062.1 TRAP transport system, periplasmic binding protein (DctP-like) [Desulfonema limicola]